MSKHIRTFVSIAAILACVLLLTSSTKKYIASHCPDLKEIFEKGDSLFNAVVDKDIRHCVSLAEAMSETVDIANNSNLFAEELAARSYLAEYYVASDKYIDAYVELTRCDTLWEKIKDDKNILKRFGSGDAIIRMLNSYALYYINFEGNYEKAVKYLIEGLDMAKSFNNYSNYIAIGSNLIMVDYIRDNPDGIGYALEIYEYSKEQDDLFAKYSGAYGVALMYYIGERYDEAEKYIKEALSYIGIENDLLEANNTYANILHAKGQDKEAEQYYIKAYENIGSKTGSIAIYTCLSYGNFLFDTGQYEKSIEILNQGIKIIGGRDNFGFSYKLYESISDSFAALHKWEDAYKYHKKFYMLSSKVFDTRKEWAINELTVKYETARKEQMLKEKEAALAKRDKALLISLLIIILTIGAAGTIYWQYINKNRTYKKIARQYSDAIQNEKKLSDKIKELEKSGNMPGNEKYALSSLAEDKNLELFNELEKLMEQKRVYHEKDISRDKVAEMIGTNRTYLSKVINDNTGKSFNQYIASLRVKEALLILSDPNMQTPLKAIYAEVGFISINTFYKAFKEEVGMTPAKYHEKIMEINKEQNH